MTSKMHPKEEELREVADATPSVPFTIVTTSGERYKVTTPDHVCFYPDTDENGAPVPEQERSVVLVGGRGLRQRLLFFDTIAAIEIDAETESSRVIFRRREISKVYLRQAAVGLILFVFASIRVHSRFIKILAGQRRELRVI